MRSGKHGKQHGYPHPSLPRAMPGGRPQVMLRPESVHTHDLRLHTYSRFTYCAMCSKLLTGVVKQGWQCVNCKLNVHKSCRDTAAASFVCSGAAPIGQAHTGIHAFKDFNSLSPANCVTCSHMIIGLKKHGLKCTNCGILVHRKCRGNAPAGCSGAAAAASKGAQVLSMPSQVQHVSHGAFDPSTAEFQGLPNGWHDDRGLLFGAAMQSQPRTKIEGYVERIPIVLVLLARLLRSLDGLNHEGIFRIAADGEDVRTIKEDLNAGLGLHPLHEHHSLKHLDYVNDAHVPAALIKIWCRSLPQGHSVLSPIDPDRLALLLATHKANKQSSTSGDDSEDDVVFEAMLFGDGLLPEPNRSVFLWLLDLMVQVVQREEKNRMTPKAVAVVFAPSLFVEVGTNAMLGLKMVQDVGDLVQQLVRFLIRRQTRVNDTMQRDVFADRNGEVEGTTQEKSSEDRNADEDQNTTAVLGVEPTNLVAEFAGLTNSVDVNAAVDALIDIGADHDANQADISIHLFDSSSVGDEVVSLGDPFDFTDGSSAGADATHHDTSVYTDMSESFEDVNATFGEDIGRDTTNDPFDFTDLHKDTGVNITNDAGEAAMLGDSFYFTVEASQTSDTTANFSASVDEPFEFDTEGGDTFTPSRTTSEASETATSSNPFEFKDITCVDVGNDDVDVDSFTVSADPFELNSIGERRSHIGRNSARSIDPFDSYAADGGIHIDTGESTHATDVGDGTFDANTNATNSTFNAFDINDMKEKEMEEMFDFAAMTLESRSASESSNAAGMGLDGVTSHVTTDDLGGIAGKDPFPLA